MRPFAAACAALALSAVASADYAPQTDWSGGGGVEGPVSRWDSTYSEAEAVNHYLPGSLGLGIVPEMSEHIPLIPSGALAHDPLWGTSTSTATSICCTTSTTDRCPIPPSWRRASTATIWSTPTWSETAPAT